MGEKGFEIDTNSIERKCKVFDFLFLFAASQEESTVFECPASACECNTHNCATSKHTQLSGSAFNGTVLHRSLSERDVVFRMERRTMLCRGRKMHFTAIRFGAYCDGPDSRKRDCFVSALKGPELTAHSSTGERFPFLTPIYCFSLHFTFLKLIKSQ